MAEERAINADKCGTAKVPLGRIVGGETAQKGQYPWMASLRFKQLGKEMHTCGSSIIDDQWILIAAHCFLNSDNPTKYTVRIGTFNQSAGSSEPEAKVVKVAKIIKHPDTQLGLKIRNDIALMKLAEKVDFSSLYINRVCLPEGNLKVDGEILTVAGWGDTVTGDGKHIPDLLKHTDLEAKTDDYCKKQWGSRMWDGSQMLCAEAPNTSPCVGDSGGPLFMTDDADGHQTQVGVVSFGEKTCSGPRPPVFTRVSNYMDWIKKTVSSN